VRSGIEVIFLLCTAAKAISGMRARTIMGGLVNPISQARCSRLRHASQMEVTSSRSQMSNALGRYKSSKKKIRDEISKKQVKNGPKIRVLKGVSREIGRPQPMRKGRDMNDMKSCSCMLLSSDWYHFVGVFIELSVPLY
jgi:hypothetical protein